MSGHSKWQQIKRQKEAKDAKRGVTFTKLAQNLTLAAKKGGPDPESNFSLRLAIEKAKQANMPKENIERAIKRGNGEIGGAQIEELVLEGFGPGQTGIIIEAVTDNKNRTISDIRNIFNKHGFHVAGSGSVSYQFRQLGVIRLASAGQDLEAIESIVIESGADDYKASDGEIIVLTEIPDLKKVKDYLESANLVIKNAKIEFVPLNLINLSQDDEEKLANFIDAVTDYDDVTDIYTNAA